MRIIRTPQEMHEWTRDTHEHDRIVGFVPTMGALHAGHSRLIDIARGECNAVVVSIFVNSLQFNRSDDFESYPRTFDADVTLCEARGVDILYAPSTSAMYTPSFQTTVTPGALAATLEGEGRPGHFGGVTTVVTKLFNAVTPQRAYFGQKDFQQLAVIKKMVVDLDFAVQIVAVPTVRDEDGLALSSRNARLSHADRVAAAALYRALSGARSAYVAGQKDASALIDLALDELNREPRARVEYVRVVDSETCVDLERVSDRATIALAVWFGDVRLVDNVSFGH